MTGMSFSSLVDFFGIFMSIIVFAMPLISIMLPCLPLLSPPPSLRPLAPSSSRLSGLSSDHPDNPTPLHGRKYRPSPVLSPKLVAPSCLSASSTLPPPLHRHQVKKSPEA